MKAKDYRMAARGALRGHWALTIVVTLVASLLGGAVGGGNNLFGSSAAAGGNSAAEQSGMVGPSPPQVPIFISLIIAGIMSMMALYALVTLIVGGSITQGLCQYNIDLVTKARLVQFGTLFSRFYNFGKAFLLQLAMSLFTFLWSLLFVIPGILAAYSYAMAPYLMAQNPNLGVFEAITLSKNMMRGNRWRLFCLQLSFIGWYFLGALTMGIGFLWVMPYEGAAVTAFYLNLTQQLPAGPAFYNPAMNPGGYQQSQ
ncbi:DUF975 family protein [Clostridia bacterium OttesenSCG-928-O13]|nr:DUF975 family protein [Clostridia bacterium OttesenSCG-928-O13]